MIRLCSINLTKDIDDINVTYNIKTENLSKSIYTIVEIMLSEKDSDISNQLKEYNTYYYDKNNKKFEKYIKKNRVRKIIIGINLDNIKVKKDIKKYIKYLKKLGKICRKYNIKIGIEDEEKGKILSAIIFNYREKLNIDNVKIEDLIDSIRIEMLKTKKQRYSFIYDKTCEILDYEFASKNLCKFKDNKCIEKYRTNIICGCCRHYKNLFSRKLIKCKYLKSKKCTANCITCKFFTCDTLKKQGIKFNINDFYLINYYFNIFQKFIIKYSYFTLENKIIKRLMLLGN